MAIGLRDGCLKAMKPTLAVIVGYVVWTVLWLVGNQGLVSAGWISKDPTRKIESLAGLSGLLAISVACSLAGGATAGRIAGASRRAAPILAGLLLATGLGVQWGFRELMPVWYHAAFLILLVPVTLAGAAVVRKG